MDTINNSNNKIHEKYKFEAARYNMVNKNLNLIFVFSNLNKPYGKMAMSQKIKECTLKYCTKQILMEYC